MNTKELIKLGFNKFGNLQLLDNKLQNESNSDFLDQIYAICVNDLVVYIGKTNRWRKRFDTYRNCVNWVSCNNSNRLKTQLIAEALLQNKNVEIYYKPAIFSKQFTDFKDNELKVSSILEEEKRFINYIKPKWNIHHNEK